MKKYTKIAYIIVIVIVFILIFFTYKVFSNNNSDEDYNNKSLAEIKYLENKFLNLFNEINNISFENYKISATEIKQEESNKQESEESSSSNGSQNSSKEQSKQGKSESSSNSESSGASNDNKKYDLERTGVLTKDSEVNWDYIKSEIENIYTSLYATTVDLYQTQVNQEDIINFNKEYDNLTKAVKDENKEETLSELSKVYNYLPKFIENNSSEEKEKIILKTKNEIFKAYSILDKEEWGAISENVNNASQEFIKLVTNVGNMGNVNQYNVNKAYVMINELRNSVLLKDKEIFLIKYKNLLEELKNI